MNANIPWFILLCPLISAALIQLVLRKNGNLSALISVATACFSFLGALVLFFSPNPAGPNQLSWIDLGPAFQIPLGATIDDLSKVMLLVVTGVGALVHIYSLVYMEEDESKARYFGGLSLFMFSMLGIVLADNFVMMFIFWELVGVSSYLLIGHWFRRPEAAKAANKAFLTNRIGDFGFMIGILMVWSATGAVTFEGIRANLPALVANPTFLTVAALCIFAGAVGKSAQFPLHVWLPDAMEGPTPVSALIHAATMVAAGVYMLARVFFLLEPSPDALQVIAWIGIITAVLAALMATQQDDIKRILAYSTLSQLGYMVAAVGLAAPGAAMFHLWTHAFFKALLFLGAGAVIYALHHEQNIWRMGGLRKRMPVTFWTFVIGSLALMGCPPLAGFASKDTILLAAWANSGPIFWIALLTAFLTAFYMARLLSIAFLGKARSHAAEHGHDGPPAMTVPLIILAILSIIAGWTFVAELIFGHTLFHSAHAAAESVLVPILAIVAFLAGALGGWVLYGNQPKDPVLIPAFKNKFYFDELYAALIAGTQDLLAGVSAWFDKWVIDGVFVRGLSGATWGTGFVMRFLQFGNLQGYAFLFGAGVIALIYLMVFTK
jgi:NADH-quinone oxidoreductase subunit L